MLNWLKNRLWIPCYCVNFKGITLEGDPKARPTTWWNWGYQVFHGWKMEVVLEINPDIDPQKYQIGFKSKNSKWGWKRILPIGGLFKVKIGKEDVIFFALDHDGKEVVVEERFRLFNNPKAYPTIQSI